MVKNLPRRQYHVRVPPEVHPSIGVPKYDLRHLPPDLCRLHREIMPPSPPPWRTKTADHRLNRGSRAPGASRRTRGRSIDTLSRNQATRIEPKANSPVPVDRQRSNCAIIRACSVNPHANRSRPTTTLSSTSSWPPLIRWVASDPYTRTIIAAMQRCNRESIPLILTTVPDM
jgi:hypothetical protein